MRNKVRETIEKFSMLEKGDKVIVGVSGGADSISLLHILKSLESELEISVSAVHVDHCLRGEESDRDREFTRSFCEKAGVPLTVVRADIRAEAEKSGKGLEETGRNVRYAAFAQAAGATGKIATAHTLSDSVETVIFNMTRGCSVKGLGGIPPVRGRIIRPLIGCSRSEVERYISTNSLEYVNDSSNFECDYSRNIIRLNVISNLKKINPSAEKAIGRMIESMRETEKYLDKQAAEILQRAQNEKGLSLEILKSAHDIILSESLMKWLAGFDIESTHVSLIKDVVRTECGAVTIAKNISVRAENGSLVLARSDGNTTSDEFEMRCNFAFMRVPVGKTVDFEIISREEYIKRQKINNLFLNKCLDYDKINSNATIRNRRDGDFFRQANRNCGKSLKKLFNERKIPQCERMNLLMLESGGEIIWIENFGSCENTKVEEKTKRILVVNTERQLGV